MDEHRRTWILDKLINFKNTGTNELDKRKEVFVDGAAVWNGEFRDDPPDDSMYYAVVFGLLRHYVRAARKMYMSSSELTSVLPEGLQATVEESQVAKFLTEEINYHLNNWNNMLPFVDDTMTQALKTGACFGKVWWERETIVEEFEDTTPQFEFGEDGGLEQSTAKRFTKERILRQKLRIEYIPTGQLVWDSTKTDWDQVDWAMQTEIEKTEDELIDLIETDGYDRQQVYEFIQQEKSRITTIPDELNKYKIAEFWGKMLTTETARRTKFVRAVMTNDGEYLLKKPSEDVYRKVDGTPFIPFEVGYLVREEGEIIGESLCYRGKEYQGEINCIRNQRRRAVENDLNERYLADKNAEVEFSRFEGEESSPIVWTADMEGVKELRHTDNTSTSYGELAAVDKNLVELLGVTPTILGMAEQGMTDTVGGLQLMSNASQVVIFDALLSYNNTFMERLLTKGLHMSLQYMTIDELQAQGLDIDSITRGEMKKNFRLRIDAGMGATSEQVKLNNLKTAYFISQQFIQYCDQSGLEPGEARLQVIDLLKQMLPLLNVKDPRYIPSPEQILENTQQMVEGIARQQQQQAQQEQEASAAEVGGFRQDAFRAGAQAAQQAQAQQDQANGQRGAQAAAQQAQGGQQ